jgi:ABC-type multidrug transport system ATPase subunit
MAEELAIEAERLALSIGSHQLLPPTDLRLPTGQIATVTGPNGSGKTTLLRLLSGLAQPTEGTAQVWGMRPDLSSAPFRQATSRLISPVPFDLHMTMAEHLRLVALTWGMSAEEATEAVTYWLDWFDLQAAAEKFPHELSTGLTQAFSLAVALVRPFQVVFLDEPEHGLDQDRLAALAEALTAAAAGQATVVVATHSRLLVEALGGTELQLAE